MPLEFTSGTDVSCVLDSKNIGSALRSPPGIISGSNEYSCAIPSQLPGSHTLLIGTPSNPIGMQEVDVTCLVMPRIFSATLLSVSVDGTYQMVFEGSYFYPSLLLKFYCLLDTEKSIANKT